MKLLRILVRVSALLSFALAALLAFGVGRAQLGESSRSLGHPLLEPILAAAAIAWVATFLWRSSNFDPWREPKRGLASTLRSLSLPFFTIWPHVVLLALAVGISTERSFATPRFPTALTAAITSVGSLLGIALCFAITPKHRRSRATIAGTLLVLAWIGALIYDAHHQPLLAMRTWFPYAMGIVGTCLGVALCRPAGLPP